MNDLYLVDITISSAPPADGIWSDSIFPGMDNSDGFANVSIVGTFAGKVTIQRSIDEEATWNDVDYFTAPEEIDIIDRMRNTAYRIGMKEGDFSSGSVTATIKKD